MKLKKPKITKSAFSVSIGSADLVYRQCGTASAIYDGEYVELVKETRERSK